MGRALSDEKVGSTAGRYIEHCAEWPPKIYNRMINRMIADANKGGNVIASKSRSLGRRRATARQAADDATGWAEDV